MRNYSSVSMKTPYWIRLLAELYKDDKNDNDVTRLMQRTKSTYSYVNATLIELERQGVLVGKVMGRRKEYRLNSNNMALASYAYYIEQFSEKVRK